jgi:hypothetical protein
MSNDDDDDSSNNNNNKVREQFRMLHKDEHSNLNRSPTIVSIVKSRRLQCAWQMARTVKTRNANRILVTKPLRKRSIGRYDMGG